MALRPLFWSRSRPRSHEVMVSGLIRVGLVVSKRSFAFLINEQLATLDLIIIVEHLTY